MPKLPFIEVLFNLLNFFNNEFEGGSQRRVSLSTFHEELDDSLVGVVRNADVMLFIVSNHANDLSS